MGFLDQRRGTGWERRQTLGRRMATDRRRDHVREPDDERRGVSIQRRAQMDRRAGNNQRSGFWFISWMRPKVAR